MPDVTFVVAAFDAAETVAASVRSALAQVDVSVEVVVVDDASSDDTAATVDAIGDPRVRVLRLEENRGAGGARNAGLAAARGDWVAVLDADDVLTPVRSRDMLRRATEMGTDLVVDNLLIVEKHGERGTLMYEDRAFHGLLTLAEYVDGNLMLDRTTPYAYGYLKPMIRRSFIESHAIGYLPHLRIGEDFVFLATALAHAGVTAVEPLPGYRYLARADSGSSTLRLHDLVALRAADDDLRRGLPLAADALDAFDRRTRSLDEAIAYFELTRSLRSGRLARAARVAREHPRALRHLRIPVEARINRLLGRTRRVHV